jgi:hypothetical protein
MIAYCLLVHKNPKQVLRLMKKIYSHEDNYYINIFLSNSNISEDKWINELKEFRKDNVFISFINKDSWGTFELVNATLNAMKYFANFEYQYFVNLSGQDYPLKDTYTIKNVLKKKNVSYIDYTSMGSYKKYTLKQNREELPLTTKYFIRQEYLHYKVPFSMDIKKLMSNFKKVIRFDTPIFLKLPRLNRNILYDFEFFIGSQWFCLTKSHVNYILAFLKENPDFVKFFRYAYIPDEHFFQIIIMNSDLKHEVINDNLRLIIWKGPPVIFTANDVEILIKSQKLFARKFDIEIDSEILDIIDSQIENS